MLAEFGPSDLITSLASYQWRGPKYSNQEHFMIY